jgi:DHA2 family multidrug resistance protein
VAIGIAITGVSLWMNSKLTMQAGFWDLAHPQMVRALGMGLVMIPLSVIALSDLPPQQRGNGAGLFNLTRELGGSIGTAWMWMNVTNLTTRNAARLREDVTAYSSAALDQIQSLAHGVGARTWDPMRGAYQILEYRVNAQASVRAFNLGFLWATVAFYLGLVLVLLLKKPKPGVRVGGAH